MQGIDSIQLTCPAPGRYLAPSFRSGNRQGLTISFKLIE